MTAASRRTSRRGVRLRTVAIAVIGLFMLLTVLRVTVAGVLQGSEPAGALRWMPLDAHAGAKAAADVAALGLDRASAAPVAQLARASLARDPTRIKALFALGASAEASGDMTKARRLMAQASELSLREREVQLWFLRYHAGRADVPAIMREFDVALRTSSRGWSPIFSMLVSASSDPAVARELSERLSRSPEWGSQFLAQLVETSTDLPTAAAITRDRLDLADPYDDAVMGNLIRRLATEGEPALAWEIYREATGAPPALLRGGDFERAGAYPPLDWQLADQPDLSAHRQSLPDGSGTVLFMEAYNDRSGEVAWQLLRLAPGSYAFSARVGDVPNDPLDRPNVRITCLGDGSPGQVLELRPLTRTDRVVRMAENFKVPGGCGWQWLTISLSSGGPRSEAAPWIDDIAIRPLGR